MKYTYSIKWEGMSALASNGVELDGYVADLIRWGAKFEDIVITILKFENMDHA